MSKGSKDKKFSKLLKSVFLEFSNNLNLLNDDEEILKLKYTYINLIINLYKEQLHSSINFRLEEMDGDLNEHFIIYKVLGIHDDEHMIIDKYQNIGRFLFKYAGALLEDIARISLGGEKIKFENSISSSPKKFEIDCYTEDDNKAHEIKWKDATTDGDHDKKEHNKIKAIIKEGYIPVRVMFFMPERKNAIDIQNKIISLYDKYGEVYVGNDAFQYIKDYSSIDIKQVFEEFIESQDTFIKYDLK